jgi:hypothetical protein
MGRATSRKKKVVRRQRKFTRRHKGGNHKHIVYYTCFFGKTGTASHKIPHLPSTTSDCFYFTNNSDASKKARESGWKVVNVNKQVKNTNRDNSVDSKELKACPHHFDELKGYTYSCYFDSKLHVKEDDVEDMLKEMHGDVVMLLNKHPGIKDVNKEFSEAMKDPRYAQDREKYEALMKDKIENGKYKNTADVHYETSCILRKSGDIVDKIGEDWLKDIYKTGAECQISFFFIQQQYKDNIRPLPRYYGRDTK